MGRYPAPSFAPASPPPFRAEKGSGRTDVQPLAPPTNKAHLPFDFDDCFFFFAITYSFGLPTPTQNNRALQMNTK